MKEDRHAPKITCATSTAEFRQTLCNWLNQQPSGYTSYYVNEALKLLESADSETDWPACSRSYNGYVRELAVRVLAHRCSQSALHVLLERANDWVPSVREQAMQAIESYLEGRQVPLLLQNLPRLLALSRQQRGDHRPLLQRVQVLMALPEHATEVQAAWFGLRGQASRFLFTLLAGGGGSLELLQQALRHPDPAVRTMALDNGRHLPASSRQTLLLGALLNRSATVRGRALRLFLREPVPHRHALGRGLLDSSASVRSIALWHAQRSGIEPAQILAQRLDGPVPSRTADWLGLLGLGASMGQRVPAAWLDTARGSTSARVRLAALAQLANDQVELLVESLEDVSPKVFRSALARLRKLPWEVLQRPVCQYLEQRWQTLEPGRREAVLDLLAYWQRMAYLLRQMDESTEPGYWLKELRTWSYQRYPTLDPFTSREERRALIERIRQLLATGQLPKGSQTCID